MIGQFLGGRNFPADIAYTMIIGPYEFETYYCGLKMSDLLFSYQIRVVIFV